MLRLRFVFFVLSVRSLSLSLFIGRLTYPENFLDYRKMLSQISFITNTFLNSRDCFLFLREYIIYSNGADGLFFFGLAFVNFVDDALDAPTAQRWAHKNAFDEWGGSGALQFGNE